MMGDSANRLRAQVVDRVVRGAGETTVAERTAAFDNQGVGGAARALVDKVARNAWKVTAEDVAATTAAGKSEDQVFELVISAALGQATRQLDAALAALDEATQEAP